MSQGARLRSGLFVRSPVSMPDERWQEQRLPQRSNVGNRGVKVPWRPPNFAKRGLFGQIMLGRRRVFTRTGRDSSLVATLNCGVPNLQRGDVSTRVADALQVRAQGSAVRSLHEHG